MRCRTKTQAKTLARFLNFVMARGGSNSGTQIICWSTATAAVSFNSPEMMQWGATFRVWQTVTVQAEAVGSKCLSCPVFGFRLRRPSALCVSISVPVSRWT